MKTIHVVLNTRGLSMPEFAVYGQSIATALGKSSNFSNLYPKLATLQSAVDDLDAAIAAAHNGDKASTAAMHAAEAELNRVLKALAAHVEYESDNSETVALSSGFSLRQPNQPAAHGFEVMYGLHSGTVDMKSPHQKNASYIWQYAADPIIKEADWQIAGITTQAGFTVKNLAAGNKYWFRVATVNKEGQQPFSDPIMLLVV
jgi:hypothetical protein